MPHFDSIESNRVLFIILRAMRGPLITLVCVYAISILGMVLIPGIEVDGETYYMSFFHAFYFVTYTATTTGFGEIPYEFSNAQRMWATLSLIVGVATWFYALGSIIRLLQNENFQQAVSEWNFTRKVQRISEPFFIICGFGDAGSLLARGLSNAGIPAVIIEGEIDRIRALELRDYKVPMPGLCADASVPKHLIEAGLQRSNCQGVVAITKDEEVNLKIAVTARLLNPHAKIITQSTTHVYEETLATLGDDIHIVDPFKTFATYLGATIHTPTLHLLNEWLSGTPGVTLDKPLSPPPWGNWILCGYGRMGKEVHAALDKQGISTAVIDPHEIAEEMPGFSYIRGRSNEKTLRKAGIGTAVGIVAGTDDDGHNLSILLNARSINPNIYSMVRQNRHENEIVFAAAEADMSMQPSLVAARRILFLMIASLLKVFFQEVRKHNLSRSEFLQGVIQQLQERVGGKKPNLLTIHVNEEMCGAVVQKIEAGQLVSMGDILRDPNNREHKLSTVALVVQNRSRKALVMPPDQYLLRKGDDILLCGKEIAHSQIMGNLQNEYTLHYVSTGEDLPHGYAMQWLARKFPNSLGKGVTLTEQ
ncbi:MAG: potassium transporter [Gammaproteobacteria bacterium]|nr:MAG: potassium transporter [Gammaproteobacteria bacterium]